MRTISIAAAVVLAVAGCTAGRAAGESSPPLRHVAVGLLPEEPAHDDDLPEAQPPGPVDRSDPATAAVELIVAGLAAQGLEVLDVGVEIIAATPAAATALVAATHRTETAGGPHTSVYELDLSRDPAGTWRLVRFRQAH
jgi:hypothetical protein